MKTSKFHHNFARRVATALALLGLTLEAPVYAQPTNVLRAGANNTVYVLALQPDGKILAGGQFNRLGAQTRTAIGRINADGTLDASFNPVNSGTVYALSVQPDGKILAGGAFTRLGGQSRSRLGRLNGDGTLDTSFNPVANNYVYSLAVQPDGSIVVGGAFTALGRQNRRYIGRLKADGTLDADFDPVSSGTVYALALQPDGMILVGGTFSKLGNQARTNIARLNSDGTLDAPFNPGVVGTVYCLALQPDGKVLVGGSFSKAGGQVRTNLARLNADGTLDSVFNLGANGAVHSLALQTDGRILVGGQFTRMDGQVRTNLARLNADGTLDNTFNSGANSLVYALALQTDGQILAGGAFSALAGQRLSRLGLIPNTDSANDTLDFDGSSLTWLRGGAGPEVWRVSFQYWIDGLGWQALGEGTYIGGGWGLDGISVPAGATVSARGHVAGGWHDGSMGCIETTIGPPAIFTQPTSRTNNAGSTTTFSVYAGGTGPLHYQWRKNGNNLIDGGNVWGANAVSLTLTGLLAADDGGYSVVITNAEGQAITSVAATLTVVDPFITVQPSDTYANLNEDVTLNVGVAGTPPFNYQWSKEGVPLAGATSSWLTLTNVEFSDSGHYTVAVANALGSITSLVALLRVNLALPDAFNPTADGAISCSVIEGDGRILVGGTFTALGGQSRTNLARLNVDGTVDITFDPSPDGIVSTLAVQADGQIVVGGTFTTLGGQSRANLARLNADGTVDATFDPGPDGGVSSLALQSDGQIVVGGAFTMLGGQSRANLARLNPDGTVDATFNSGADDSVLSLALQPDGKIVAGGMFTTLGGQSCTNVARLNADGSPDTTFNALADSTVYCLALQADGKILLGGEFYALGGQTHNYIGRLNADGSPDNTFNALADSAVYCLALQADGRILLGGEFYTVDELNSPYIGRLNPDGTADMSFDPGTDNPVTTLAVQADGNILVGGNFSMLAGRPRSGIGRLNNTDPATQNLGFDGSTITWLRGGTSPEVWRTTFDASTNGTDWVSLGAGARIAEGWRIAGVSILGHATLRARGYVTGGQDNGSAWFVETAIIVNHPPVADASATRPTAISANGSNAPVILNGTRSSDSDGDPLEYAWYEAGNPNPLAHGIVAVVVLPVGSHSLALVVNDGKLTATNAFTLEVITAAQAVGRLIAQINSSWPRPQPLVATLSAALASIERGDSVSACNQLSAFQNKVQAQVAQKDPALAAAFTQAAQEIIDALRAGDSHPGNGSHGRFISVSHPSRSRARVQFAAPLGLACLVEASTDLVTWETIGLAEDQGDGTFAFEDANAAKYPGRYYRIRQVLGE